MAISISIPWTTDADLVATAQRVSDNYYWNNTGMVWEASPSFVYKSIPLYEGSAENLGSYSGANSGNMGSAGAVIFRVHDLGNSNITIGETQINVINGIEVLPDDDQDDITNDSIMVVILRYLINDLDNQQFADDRLLQAIVVAAQQIITELDLDVKYDVDIPNKTITPDPESADTRDDIFINLCCLKAACMIDRGRFRSFGQGVRIQDGENVVDTTGSYKTVESMLKNGNCAAYENAKDQYLIGNRASGTAILGPYSLANLYPSAVRNRPRWGGF